MKKAQVAAIITSSYPSNVMPGKSEKVIGGMTVLAHIAGRLRRVPEIDKICVATSEKEYDNNLYNLAASLGLEVYRGSSDDLISRMAGAAKQIGMPYIVKVMGNYPLIDPEMTSAFIWKHISGGYEYSFNEHNRGVVFGMGCEVINSKRISNLNKNSRMTANQRAAGTLYFLQNKHLFNTFQFDYDNPRPGYKVCLETKEDMLLIEAIFTAIRIPRIESVIEFMDANPIVARSNLYDTAKEVGLEKLWFFPEKAHMIQEVSPGKPDLSYPASVELSLTNRCNFRCVYCSDKGLRKRLGGNLDMRILKALILDLKEGGTGGIVFEGGGEPLLYEQFNEAVKYVHDRGLGCGLITNGSKRIHHKTLKLFDWIRVSVDASNENEFKKLKGARVFESVLNNISEYILGCPVVGVGYVVTSRNLSSVEPLILRFRNMGVAYVQFRPVIDHPELLPEVDLHYLKRYESPQFRIIIDGMEENKVIGNSGLPCRAHSITSVVTADGGVYLCGRLNKHPWLREMGNLRSTSFKDIWHGAVRSKQADMVLSSEFCKNYCPECRITKFNELLHRLNQVTTRRFI